MVNRGRSLAVRSHRDFLAKTRRFSVVLIATLVAISLTGCSPTVNGLTGVSISSDGHPIIVVQICEGYIDTAEIFADLPSGKSPTLRQWNLGQKERGYFTAPFAEDSKTPSWLVDGPTFNIITGAADSSGSTRPIAFTKRDMLGLDTESVLIPNVEDSKLRVVSLATFKMTACK
jgi:hypothetical protein